MSSRLLPRFLVGFVAVALLAFSGCQEQAEPPGTTNGAADNGAQAKANGAGEDSGARQGGARKGTNDGDGQGAAVKGEQEKTQQPADGGPRPVGGEGTKVAGATTGAAAALHTQYLQPNHTIAVVLNAQRLQRSETIKPFLADRNIAGALDELPLPAEDIRRVTMFVGLEELTAEHGVAPEKTLEGALKKEPVEREPGLDDAKDVREIPGEADAADPEVERLLDGLPDGEEDAAEPDDAESADAESADAEPSDADSADVAEEPFPGDPGIGDEDFPVAEGPPVVPSQNFVVIVEATRPITKDEVIAKMPYEPQEEELNGKTLLRTPGPAIYFADERTLVAADGAHIDAVLAGKGAADSPLAQRLAGLTSQQLDVDLLLVAAIEPMRDEIRAAVEQGGEVPPTFAPVVAKLDQLDGAILALDVSGEMILTAHLDAKDAQSAGEIAGMVEGLRTLGTALVAQVKKSIPPGADPMQAMAVEMAEKVLAALSIESREATVAIRLARPEGMDEALEGVLPAIAKANEQSEKMNKLHQIGLAMIIHADTHGKFPANSTDDEGQPLLSWRVHILPFLEEQPLYEKFRLDESWDSEHNKPLIEQVPNIFTRGGEQPTAEGLTPYVVAVGEGTPFAAKGDLSFARITDGTSQTIAVVEAGPDKMVPWTKPEDMKFDAENPLAGLGKVGDKFLAIFFDGHVQAIRTDQDADTLRKMFQHADGGQ